MKTQRSKGDKDVDHASESVSRALLEAVGSGNATLVVNLLDEGADVDRSFARDDAFSLLLACGEFLNVNVQDVPDYLNICRILLAYGADVDAPVCREGQTVTLLQFIGMGDDDHRGRSMTEVLIQYGADVNGVDRNGCSPLMHFCFKGHVGCAEVLLRNGADVNEISANGGSTALLVAASKCHADLVQLLLMYGADRKLVNDDGVSPMFTPAPRVGALLSSKCF